MPPTRSSAADFDPATHRLDPLIDAAVALAEQQAIGIIWLDPDLRVLSLAGFVPSDVKVGAAIVDCLVPLLGLDTEMLALKSTSLAEPMRLANTAVMTKDGAPSQRFDIKVFWNRPRQRFLVLLSVIFMQDPPTVELDQEIRRRRLIEQDLASKSLEYARINQQLEEFVYVISHDLNAPLRALRYLSRDIQDALHRPQGIVDTDLLSRAVEDIAVQTRRMSKMLTDLLDYARVGRVEDAIEAVATRRIIGDIVASLRPTTKLELVVSGEWPAFDTAPAPLDLVLRNLVENAVKHHDLPHGRVVISAEAVGRHIVFEIADDGRGIPEEWQSAIFEPFRKIDDAHHPESSGIGLALVKKTITTLGGTIEVQSSAPQKRGTTFIVNWPLNLKIAVGPHN